VRKWTSPFVIAPAFSQSTPSAKRPEVSARFLGHAFGVRWSSDLPLTQFSAAHDKRPADVALRRVDRLTQRRGGIPVGNGRVFEDGARFTFGSHIFDTFRDHTVEWCGPGDGEVPAAFYGTVAAIVLAWRGLTPLHASAVEVDGRAILIAGPSGAGKSTLCHTLTQAGGRLVSDDLSALAPATAPGIPNLLPGRPHIRMIAAEGPADERPKVLHGAAMTDPDQLVPVSLLAVLGARSPTPGAVAAHQALAAQIFRPRWMRALPLSRERAATMLHVAGHLDVCGLPGAAEQPEVSVREKVEYLLARLATRGTY
jgi:energy-coupling factor transporter ATP-binding protein EcfA2